MFWYTSDHVLRIDAHNIATFEPECASIPMYPVYYIDRVELFINVRILTSVAELYDEVVEDTTNHTFYMACV